MNSKDIKALMEKHRFSPLYQGGYGSTGVTETPDGFTLRFGDMPQLTFFVELSGLCRVPLESIKIYSSESYGGCDTCGYGVGVEYEVFVPRPRDSSAHQESV